MLFKKKSGRLRLFKSKNNIFKYKSEVIAIIIFAIFVLLFISLFSYNPTDPSWFYITTEKTKILNWCGIFGANMAASLLYFFGSVSYLFIFGLLFISYLLIAKKSLQKDKGRIFSLVTLIVSFSALFRIFKIDFTKSFPGGFLGHWLLKSTFLPVGPVGSKVFYITIAFVSLIILFRISFFTILKKIIFLFYFSLKTGLKYIFKFLKIALPKLALLLWMGLKAFGRMLKRGFYFCYQKIFKKDNKELISKDDFNNGDKFIK